METIGHVTPWGVHCGVAKHLSYWLPELCRSSVIYAEEPPPWYSIVETWGTWTQTRCWRRAAPGVLTALARRAADDGVRILHVQWDPGFFHWRDLLDARNALDRFGGRLIATTHCLIPRRPWTKPNTLLCRVADRIVAGTPHMVQVFEDYARAWSIPLRAPVAHVPLPHMPGVSVRSAKRELTGNPPVVLTWGMLGAGKGHLEVCEAVSHLRANGRPNLRYVILGRALTGEQRRHLAAIHSRAHADPGAIEIHEGFFDDDAIVAACRAADVIVLNHQHNHASSSGTIATSVASGTPVVVSESPMFSGYEDAVEVAGPGPDGMAAAIDRALEYPYSPAPASAMARRTSPAAVAAQYEELYAELEQREGTPA